MNLLFNAMQILIKNQIQIIKLTKYNQSDIHTNVYITLLYVNAGT